MMTENNIVARFIFRGMISVLGFPTGNSHITRDLRYDPGGGVLPMMAYTGRLRPKEVSFSGFRFMKEEGFH